MCVLRVTELEQTELSVSYRSLFVLTLLSRNIKKQWNARFLLKKTSWNWKLLTWSILWILALKSQKAQSRTSWFCWSCPRRAGVRLLSTVGVTRALRTKVCWGFSGQHSQWVTKSPPITLQTPAASPLVAAENWPCCLELQWTKRKTCVGRARSGS